MDDFAKTPSYFEATGDNLYYHQACMSPAGQKSFLAIGVNRSSGTLIIQAKENEATVSLTAIELRRLAGALLDAADAIENAERTGNIKLRNPTI